MDRRQFLHRSVGALITMRFGRVLAENVKGEITVVYATRYGATRDTAGWIAQGIRDKGKSARLMDFHELSAIPLAGMSNIVMGSGIWSEGPDEKMLAYCSNHAKELSPRIIASFIVCGTPNNTESGKKRIQKYFARFHQSLTVEPKYFAAFGGRMSVDLLTTQDREKLTRFYKKLGRNLKNWDRTQPEQARTLGKELAEFK